AQQAALAAARDLAPDVEKYLRLQDAVLDDADGTALLDDEDAMRIESRRGDVQRVGQARGDPDRGDRGPGDRRHAGADRGRVLELAGCGAAVARAGVAVVALLRALDDAVAAHRGCDG